MVESIVNTLLFKPPAIRPYDFPSRLIHLQTKHREQITATYIKNRNASLTMIYSHGNAEDLNTCYSWMRRLSRDLNVNVIGYDYTGYGLSTGMPSEHNCYSDILSVFEYLVNVRKLSPHQIVLYGRSVGSGPSCWLAAKSSKEDQPVGGLILHSPFTSVYRVVMNLFNFTLSGDKFPNIDHIREVTCPVLICHGTLDEIVPYAHGYNLYKSVREECRADPFWMEDCGHNDHGPIVEAELMQKMNIFLDYHLLARRLYLMPTKKKHVTNKYQHGTRSRRPLTRMRVSNAHTNRRGEV